MLVTNLTVFEAEKRRKAFQERRLAREKKIDDSLSIWEKEIVPDWKVVHKNPALRKIWWEGIPTKLRASMWANAVGNALALSKGRYRIFFVGYFYNLSAVCRILTWPIIRFYLRLRQLPDVSCQGETRVGIWHIPFRHAIPHRTRYLYHTALSPYIPS